LILASFCFLVLNGLALAQKTEVDYPQVSGAETPRTVKTFLPDYIKYLFNLALLIAALVTFGSLVYGGFRYLASAGNPLAISDAKSQITAGILGLIILLIAYVILIQLNPELVVLKIGKVEFNKGVILYKERPGIDCNSLKSDTSGLIEGEDFLRVRSNYSSLGDFNNEATSVYFYDSAEEMEIKIFPEENYEGTPWESDDHDGDDCKPISGNSQSVRLIWKMPGVYLFSDDGCKADPHLFTSSVSDLSGSINFDNKAKSIKIIPRRIEKPENLVWDDGLCPGPWVIDCNINPQCCRGEMVIVGKLGAVLHEHNDFRGDAEVFFGGTIDEWPPRCIPLSEGGAIPECNPLIGMDNSYCVEHVEKDRVSSISVFVQRPPDSSLPSGGITLYQNYNFNEDENGAECGIYPIPPMALDYPQWIDAGWCPTFTDSNGISSLRVEGNFSAVLFRGDGRGEVFTASDIRLKDNHIGDNQTRAMLVIPVIKKGM